MTFLLLESVTYNYSSGLDSNISRLSSLSDTSGTLESYSYLGLGTYVVRAHSQPGIDLTYVKQSGEGNGDAGDQYTGLDRFDRIVDQRWLKTSDGSHTDRFKYAYDRNGNRLYRTNELNHNFDELYHANGASNGYDSLNQLTDFRRGTLTDANSDGILDTVTTASRSQNWSFDPLGNWSSLTTDGTSVSRTHNKQNQVTAVGNANLTFDANGNTTTDETGKQFVYDAWNRLVTVKNSGGTTLTSYQVDALKRRVVENPGTARDLYYSEQWQVLEERVSGSAQVQYVWSPVYVDAMVLRDRDADANSGNGLEERRWAQVDANHNVTATLTAASAVAERYAADAYGFPSFFSSSWSALSSSAYNWNYLHQGGRYDGNSTQLEFRMRNHSLFLGRWTVLDPVGHATGEPNLYRYIDNSPISSVDPSGLWSWAGCAGGATSGALLGGGIGFFGGGGPIGGAIGGLVGAAGGCLLGGFFGEDVASWATGKPKPSDAEVFAAGFVLGIPAGIAGGIAGIYGGPAVQAWLLGPKPPPPPPPPPPFDPDKWLQEEAIRRGGLDKGPQGLQR